MNKNLKTAGKLVLAVSALVLGGRYIWKTWKRETEKFAEDGEKKEVKDVPQEDKSVITPEESKTEGEEVVEEKKEERDENLVKQVYKSLLFNPDFDLDVIDCDKIFPPAGRMTLQNVVHVRQVWIKKRRQNRLDFLFEIPKNLYTGSDDKRNFAQGGLTVESFRRAFMGYMQHDRKIPGFAEKMRERLVIVRPEDMRVSLEGYVHLIFTKEDGEVGSSMIKITDDLISEDSDLVGTMKYFSECIDLGQSPIDFKSDHVFDPKMNSVILGMRVSFFIADDENLNGITVAGAVDLVNWILENVEVSGKYGYNSKFRYEYFLFYDPYTQRDSNELCVYEWNRDDESGGTNVILTHII